MKVTCPECNREYEVDEGMRGLTVYCTAAGCDGIIAIPKKRNSTQRFSMGKTVSSGRSFAPEGYEVYEKMQKMFDWQKRMLAFLIFSLLLSVFFFACAENEKGNAKHLSFIEFECENAREYHLTAIKILERCRESSYSTEAEVRDAEIAAEEAKKQLDEKRARLDEMKKTEESSDFYFAVAGVILGFCGVLLFVFMVLHWIFIHCGWSLVPRKDAVTTPNKAIWLNFVPGLMPFWNWVTYFELGRHYSELTGRRGNKVLALIMSVMTTLGGPVLLLAWFVMVLVMQGELLRSAEIIVKEKDFDD